MFSFSPGLALCPEVQDLLEGCELPDLPSSLLLPEDMALRNLPPLRAAHRHFNFDTDRLLLSALEEVRISFLMPEALLLVRLGSKAGAQGRSGWQAPSHQDREHVCGCSESFFTQPFGLPFLRGGCPSTGLVLVGVSLCRTGLLPLFLAFVGDRTSQLLGLWNLCRSLFFSGLCLL